MKHDDIETERTNHHLDHSHQKEITSKILDQLQNNNATDWEISFAEWSIDRALGDCWGLDAAGISPSLECSSFTDQFLGALEKEDAYYQVLLSLEFCVSSDLQPKGGFLVTDSPEEDERERILHWFRTLLQDGCSAPEALSSVAGSAGPIMARGDTEFVRRLSKEMQKSHKRSRVGWLRRMWLPLALWECLDGRDGSKMRVRCFNAAKAAKIVRPEQQAYKVFDSFLDPKTFGATLRDLLRLARNARKRR